MITLPIKATFIDEITYDITCQHWTEKDWIKDLDSMVEFGIDTVVIMRSVFYDKILYPSKVFTDKKQDYNDFLELIFAESDKRNLKVYLGLYISNLCWNDGDYVGEIEQNKKFLDEVLPMYKHHPSFVGFYIPHEVGHDSYNIIETTNGLTKLCKERMPEKKIFISPFFRSPAFYPDYPPRLNPDETYKEWDYIFSKIAHNIDICAFQDGTCTVEELPSYLDAAKRVCDKYNIILWNNIESFQRDENSTFPPQDFEVLKKKIEIADKYCENMITFEFSHFLSPNSMYEKARINNKKYLNYYKK